MKSLSGFLAAVVFLIMLPLAILCQVIFHEGAETVIHFLSATGFLLIAISVFDFRLPGWINWIGRFATATLAFIFLLQGISNLSLNESLFYLAFQVLGQQLEGWLIDLLIFWFLMLSLIESRGKTKILGIAVMSLVVGLQFYSFVLSSSGSSLDEKIPALKVLYLLIFVWFLFESRQALPNSANNNLT